MDCALGFEVTCPCVLFPLFYSILGPYFLVMKSFVCVCVLCVYVCVCVCFPIAGIRWVLN
jgi:hypothetical protein